MKNRMIFHYFFTLWISYFAIFGVLFLLLLPNNIFHWFTSITNEPDNLLYWSQIIVKNIIMGYLCLLALPIFYSLLHRINLNIKKMTTFLWTYFASRIILLVINNIGALTSEITFESIILFGVEIIFTFYIIQAILDYYRSRDHLFSRESKEFQRAKFMATINRLTFGIISFER